MKTKLLSAFGLAISGLAIAYMLSQFGLENTVDDLRQAQIHWLLIAALAYLGLFPLRGLRWSWLLGDIKSISVSSATQTLIIGAMANNILPARLGDLVRAFLLSRREKIPATATFSNVLLERIIDGCTVIALMSGVLIFAPPTADWVKPLGLLMATVFFAAFCTCVLLAVAPKRFWRLADPILGILPDGLASKLRSKLDLLLTGIKVLANPRRMIRILLISLVIWLSEVAVYVLCQQAFGLEIPLSGSILLMAILTLGLTAPSGPGFVGVFEGLLVAGLSLYGVDGSAAFAFAIAMHLIHYLPVTMLGVVYLWRTGLRIQELQVDARQTIATPHGGT